MRIKEEKIKILSVSTGKEERTFSTTSLALSNCTSSYPQSIPMFPFVDFLLFSLSLPPMWHGHTYHKAVSWQHMSDMHVEQRYHWVFLNLPHIGVSYTYQHGRVHPTYTLFFSMLTFPPSLLNAKLLFFWFIIFFYLCTCLHGQVLILAKIIES